MRQPVQYGADSGLSALLLLVVRTCRGGDGARTRAIPNGWHLRCVLALIALLLSTSPPCAAARQQRTEAVPQLEAPRGTDPAPLLRISVPKNLNGKVIAPGATTKLKVKVTTAEGQAVNGAPVLFVAPESGATGMFQGATPSDATFLRVTTNSKGVAKAKFTANSTPGVFLIEAVVESDDPDAVTVASTSFAISTIGSTPALAADKARLAVQQQLLENATEDATFRLHGPVLLPAGTVVSGGPGTAQYPSQPATVTETTWFFWIDEAPYAQFEHPTRFVYVDAADTTPSLATEAIITREGWYPNVTLPGAAEDLRLVAPFLRNQTVVVASRPQGREQFDVGVAQDPPPDACAIVVYGPSESAHGNSARRSADFLRTSMRVPEGNIYQSGLAQSPPSTTENPAASKADVAKLFALAKENGCKKIWVVLVCHGYGTGRNGQPGGFCFRNVDNSDGSTEYDYLSYDELGKLLEPFAGMNTELCAVVNACHSGGVVGYLHNRGVTGKVITSADANNLCYMFPGPTGYAFFIDRLLFYMSFPSLYDENGDGTVSLEEAHAAFRRNHGLIQDGTFTDPGHQLACISETSLVWPVDALTFKVKNGEPIDINLFRPMGATGQVKVRVKVTDPTIAALQDENGDVGERNVLLTPAAPTRKVQIIGRKDGVTTYMITVEDLDSNETYTGMATIQVGCGYGVGDEPICVNDGETTEVLLCRFPPALSAQRPSIVTVTSSDDSVATVAPSPLVFLPGVAKLALTVRGETEGTVTITVKDAFYDLGTSFQVTVKPVEECSVFDGTAECTTGNRDDLCMHHPFVNITGFILTITEVDGVITVSGSNPQMCPALGTMDVKCTLTTAECTATVAGFQNVRTQWRNLTFAESQDPATGAKTVTVTGQYALGIGGELPGGCPIVYDFSGTVTP